MNKKLYEQPLCKVIRVEMQQVIAMSATDGGLRGTVSDDEVTDGWANAGSRTTLWGDD